ncbi:unnamed protein product [Paramecium primaurelia]|uniref:Uncharacterized protein n=1 Tax=Paramecium primaurelia TaxID=5886 RepID=A0A8S1QHQ1_PARPR|nr:unnamed protein product [Paramecium primaurelia]
MHHRDDNDPYSTAIVEDLLQSQSEWKNINDIIRLTFKALTDVVKSQGESIREIEKQLSTRASKNELHSGLALKANINDISRTIAEIAANLDTKITYEDSQVLLKDYVLKADMQYLLSNKIDVDEMKQLLEKQQSGEFKGEMQNMKHKIEELQTQISKKFQQVPSMKDFSQLSQQVELKANLQEMNELLETKASKHQVQQAVNKKISKQELDQILQNYSSLEDLQPIIQNLDQKASLDQIDKIASILEVKVDRQDFSILINSLQNKAEIHQLEVIKEQQQELKNVVDSRLQDNNSMMVEMKQQVDGVTKQLNKKVDNKELDKYMHSINSLQGEMDGYSQRFNKFSQEIISDLDRLRNEILESKQFTSEQMQTTIMKSTHLSEKLTEELYNLSENIKQMDDDKREELDDLKKVINTIKIQKKDIQQKVDQMQEYLDEFKSDQVFKQLQRQVQQMNKEISEVKAKQLSYEDEQHIQVQIEQQLQRRVNEIKKSGSNQDGFKNIKQEVSQIVSKKISSFEQQLNQLEINLKQRVLFQDFEELKNIIQKLCIDQDERAYQKDLTKHIQLTKYTLDLIQKDMMLKAGIQDMITILDTKANIPEINQAFEAIHNDLQTKVSADDLSNYLKSQNQIYESLCQENIVARFQWRSGETQNHLIPWEYEVINTLPENFVWEKGKSSILIVAPGVYHIAYAFFSKEKQTVSVLINGENIATLDQKKKSSEYTGLNAQDFIVLPNRARLQVSYSGGKGEGFLSLKRL